ncbi:Pleckstrin homology domain-containing protein [Coniochaeta sp. 2T2.1]|nr:Pleckstrin homology domain-containing protein [Coniochaeta sp. 2T2.1]
MADVQKPVEVTPAAVPVVEPVTETKIEETPAATTEAALVTETTPAQAAEATTAVEETPATAAAATEETKKEEVTPVEEGHLEHKGSNFPKNFLYSKKFFWFGSEPVDTKAVSTFKHDKVADVAHHVAAWASETGKGLLFFSERADKSAPHGAIQLAEATEPTAEGTNKFHITSKGHKHTFKAGSLSERDNWVSQLKLKIAEAKDLAKTIPETETYKKTLESFKPKKEEKPVAAAPVAAAPVATEPATETAATEETPKVEEPVVPTVAAAEEVKKEETKKEEPKRRSASRKRGSIFGGSLFGKKEEKKEEEKSVEAAPAETKAAETEAPAAETTPAAAVTEAPAAETTAVVATEPAPEVTAPEIVAPVAETKAEEPKVEEPKTETKAAEPKPKRASIFGTLSFGKKSKATSPERSPAPAAEETPVTTEAVAETAPVIPAVETTEPLSAEVSSPATVPTETVDAGAPATNGEVAASKNEVKNEKRKSSLPFGLGAKKEKTASDDEAEKPKSPSPFSKLRQTIKGKGKSDKPAEKAAEKPAEDKPAEAEPATEAAKDETKPVETTETPAVPAVEEPVVSEKPLAATPAVQAAA